MAMQRKRRRRSGGNNTGNSNNNPNKHFESNGPDVRIRGSAQQILDKYLQYARDAQTSGDRVKAEALFQHAEHYARIVAVFEKQKDAERLEREARDAARAEERAQRDAERDAERAARREANGGADSEDDETAEAISEENEAKEAVAEDSPDDAPKPRRRSRKPRDSEAKSDDPLKVIDDESSDEASAEEKPKRRRRSYARSDDDGGNDGVMKTLSRGVEEAPAE